MIFLSPQVPVWLGRALCDSPHRGPLITSFTPERPSCSPKLELYTVLWVHLRLTLHKSKSQMHAGGFHWATQKGKLFSGKHPYVVKVKQWRGHMTIKSEQWLPGASCIGHWIPLKWPPLSWRVKLFHVDVLDMRLWSDYLNPWDK